MSNENVFLSEKLFSFTTFKSLNVNSINFFIVFLQIDVRTINNFALTFFLLIFIKIYNENVTFLCNKVRWNIYENVIVNNQ